MFADPVAYAVSAALAALAEGADVGAIESQLIDCKEPTGTVKHNGIRVPFSELTKGEQDDAARQLAAEATCLAHGGGGALLIGIRDDRAGLAAFVGTDMDADWLRLRIHELTTPSLTVAIDNATAPDGAPTNAPILVVRVLPAVDIHAVTKSDGTGERPSRWRVGRACVPMAAADHAIWASFAVAAIVGAATVISIVVSLLG